MVLVEVLVGALRAVEEVHGVCFRWGSGLDLFVGCVFVRIRDFGELAVAAHEALVPGSYEESGEGG